MKLAKHDPKIESELNMTSMIDVVFLLIMFFMVVTDMSQSDLEDLQLPVALNAVPDKPNPDDFRPIVNIKIDGSMWVKRRCYYKPEAPDDYKEMRTHLAEVAARMEKKDGFPDLPLLIRADENTPFKEVQKLMEQCAYKGIQIWKIQLAASEATEEEKREGGVE